MELYSGNDSDEANEGDSAITSERQFWLRIIEVGLLTVPVWLLAQSSSGAPTASASSSAGHQIEHLCVSYTPSDVSTNYCSFTCAIC